MNLQFVETAVSPTAYRASNRLLAALSSLDYRRLAGDLAFSEVIPRQIIQRDGEPVDRVFFPERGLCSLMQTMEDGATVEVAMIGAEGMIGIAALLGDSIAFGNVVARTAGAMHTLPLDVFRREIDQRGGFRELMTRYCQSFLGVAALSAACNGLHSARQRISRWLLAASDRLQNDDLTLTHELLAMILGVRRPTVTILLEQLAKEEIIWQHRGKVRIVNRPALLAAACECYAREKYLFGS
jgi:CRP-like cAMP-binding protein